MNFVFIYFVLLKLYVLCRFLLKNMYIYKLNSNEKFNQKK